MFRLIGRDVMAKEGSAFILHSLRYHPWENLQYAVSNPVRLLLLHIRPHSIRAGLTRDREHVVKKVARHYPQFDEQMKLGLQYNNRLDRAFSDTAACVAFYFSLLFCALLPLIWLLGGRRGPSTIWVLLPVSALAYVLLNAVVSGNFNSLSSARMHIKMLYVPILVTTVFCSWMLRNYLLLRKTDTGL